MARGLRKRRFMGFALAGLALFAVLWIGRNVGATWWNPILSTPSEEPGSETNVAGSGAPSMLAQRADRRSEPRPYLGITYVPVNPRLASRYELDIDWGVLVTGVAEGGPAGRAGLRDGDIVLYFDGHALNPEASLLDLLWRQSPGATIRLVVWREGRHFATEAVLGTR